MALTDELKKMTVPQLKNFARDKNINLDGVSKKPEILEIIFSFIPKEEVVETGSKVQTKTEKVALYSSRNIHWNGMGSLTVGYNIVNKEDSKNWLKHKAVREASPQEVARYYGK